jgi:hypothetical protein
MAAGLILQPVALAVFFTPLMSALCARRRRLALAPAEVVRVEVVNRYRRGMAHYASDLAYGGEAWAVLRLTAPRSLVDTGGAGDVPTRRIWFRQDRPDPASHR